MIFLVLPAELYPPFLFALPLPVNCQAQAQSPPSPLYSAQPRDKDLNFFRPRGGQSPNLPWSLTTKLIYMLLYAIKPADS